MKRLSAADGLTVTCFCFYFMKLRRSKCLAGAVEGGAQCLRAALECSRVDIFMLCTKVARTETILAICCC